MNVTTKEPVAKVKGFVGELRKFALRGNAVDLAVGVIIGGAFGNIVNSLVNDIIMPPIGVLIGGVDFTDLKITLKDAVVNSAGESVAAVTLNYGNFLQVIFNFLIIALCVFLIIKLINQMKTKPPVVQMKEPSKELLVLEQIRDLLKKQK
jgi:large conductance mechanosensitive channel